MTDNQNQYQFSQEFQWLGRAFNDKLEYVAGLYYFKENGFVHDFVPFQGLLYVYDYQNDVDTESYAGFLHIDYKFTDHFAHDHSAAATRMRRRSSSAARPTSTAFRTRSPAAIRRTRSSIRCHSARRAAFRIPAGRPASRRSASRQRASRCATSRRSSRSRPSRSSRLRFGLQWTFSDDAMTYVKYSEGFKSGGWTTRLSQPITDGTFAEFKPERAESYELGLKSVFFDNRFLVNTAVFYTDYDDIQLNFQEGRIARSAQRGQSSTEGHRGRVAGSPWRRLRLYLRGRLYRCQVHGSHRDRHHDRQQTAEDSGVQDQFRARRSIRARQRQQLALRGRLHVHRRHGQRLTEHGRTCTVPATDNLNASIRYSSPERQV